jgi:hypothetical protein
VQQLASARLAARPRDRRYYQAQSLAPAQLHGFEAALRALAQDAAAPPSSVAAATPPQQEEAG